MLLLVIVGVIQESYAASFCTKADQCALDEEIKTVGAPAPLQARYDHTRIYQVELASEEEPHSSTPQSPNCCNKATGGITHRNAQKLDLKMVASVTIGHWHWYCPGYELFGPLRRHG